jgi:transcriptional regulator with XRE-family HTH domain
MRVEGMSNDDDLAGRARRERRRQGLTQEQVAERAGVSLRAYQMFETRKSVPQSENLRAILGVLDIAAEGDATAQTTRSGWPLDVQVFLDVMGAYLVTLSEEVRLSVIHGLTRQIFDRER